MRFDEQNPTGQNQTRSASRLGERSLRRSRRRAAAAPSAWTAATRPGPAATAGRRSTPTCRIARGGCGCKTGREGGGSRPGRSCGSKGPRRNGRGRRGRRPRRPGATVGRPRPGALLLPTIGLAHRPVRSRLTIGLGGISANWVWRGLLRKQLQPSADGPVADRHRIRENPFLLSFNRPETQTGAPAESGVPLLRTHEYIRPGLYFGSPSGLGKRDASCLGARFGRLTFRPRANVLVCPGYAAAS